MSPQLLQEFGNETIKRKKKKIHPSISHFNQTALFLSAAINWTTRFINPDFRPKSDFRSEGVMSTQVSMDLFQNNSDVGNEFLPLM